MQRIIAYTWRLLLHTLEKDFPMTDRPNVLVFCLDQMRQDFFSLHGHPVVRTPHMDSIGGCGVSFMRARSECPTCIPARQTLMTGLDPWGINMFHNVGGQPLPEGAPLAGCLSDAGYQTHAVGKMHWFPEQARYGFDEVECDEEYRKFPKISCMIMSAICKTKVSRTA